MKLIVPALLRATWLLWQRSLATRVTLFTLAIFIASLWSLTFYSSRMLRLDMQHLLGQQQLSTATYVATEIDTAVRLRLRVLGTLAARITPAMLADNAVMQTYLDERVIIQDEFNAGAYAVRADGYVVADSMVVNGRVGNKQGQRAPIAATLQQGASGVGPPQQVNAQGGAEFLMAVPIRDRQEQVIGALVGSTDLGRDNFLQMIEHGRYGQSGSFMLIAAQPQRVVSASDRRLASAAGPAPAALLERFAGGHEGPVLAVDAHGTEVLVSAKRIAAADWQVLVLLPTDEAFAPIRALQQRMLQAALLLTVLAGALSWWMLRRQLTPMLHAAKALAGMSVTGQGVQALAITRQDEVGDMIGGFNRLLQTLAQQGNALRESELRYRTLADFTADWEYWQLPDGTLRYMSPSCMQISGYSAAQFYADPQLLRRIIHADDGALFDGHSHHLSKLGVPLPIDFRIQAQDGSTVWVSHVCQPVFDPAGQPLGLRGSNRDISTRKQTEAALARSHADLQRFAEVTAHHLQEPARRIASYSERLGRQLAGRLDDAEAQLSLDFIGQQARRQQSLLRDVERYLAADQPRAALELADVQQCVGQLLKRWQARIELAQASIRVGQLPAVWIDRPRLNDLFEVALDNALNHGRSAQPLQIVIDGRLDGHQSCFCVSDNGSGVEPQYRERIFRVFERLSADQDSSGTGIGLAILRRIAESCGGTARMEGSASGGARLVFELTTEKPI